MIDLLATDLLASATEALDYHGRPLPDRRYVAHGIPVWDCEQLVVAIRSIEQRIERGVGQTSAAACATVGIVTLDLAIVRCVPTVDDQGRPPDADALTDSAVGLASDASVLWDLIAEGRQDGTLFGSFDGIVCSSVTVTQARADTPSGGLAGWTFPVRVTLDAARVAV